MALYHTLPPLSLSPEPVASLAFDPYSDVLWSGSISGIVSSYNGLHPSGTRYPIAGKFPPPGGVKRIIVNDKEVRSLCELGVGGRTRGGVSKWYHRSLLPLLTFTTHPTSSTALVLSSSNALQELALPVQTVSRQIPMISPATHLRTSAASLVVAGSSDGFIRTYDIRQQRGPQKYVAEVKAHNGAIQGMETSGVLVYTIGLGVRQGRPFPDPIIQIYDVRNLRAMSPVPFSAGPAVINVHPMRSTMIFVASSSGLTHAIDISDQNSGGEFHQLDIGSYVTTSALSPSGAYVAYGDAEGLVHLLTTTAEEEHVPFNGSDGLPAELPDPIDPLPQIEWDNTTPLNMIGMPYYTSPLLSRCTTNFVPGSDSFVPPPKIPAQVLASMKIMDYVGWAAMPREMKGRRNVVTKREEVKEIKFRSERAKRRGVEDTPLADQTEEQIPKHYRKVEIEYSNFGVEDFDFARYNRTPYSGLETHILNCYTNALLQTLYFTLPIRLVALSHIAVPCPKEQCLLCEVGFVCKMLEDARGVNCHSGNFCKVMGSFQQANALGLIETDYQDNTTDYGSLIQTFHRFLLEQMSVEADDRSHGNPGLVQNIRGENMTVSTITQLNGLITTTVVTCLQCRASSSKDGVSHVVDLVYPRKGLSNEVSAPNDFPSILSASLSRNMTYKGTCPSCRNVTISGSRRVLRGRSLPPLLAVNAAPQSMDHAAYWADGKKGERFLPSFVTAKMECVVDNDGNQVTEVQAEYELQGLVVQVKADKGTSHLVALLKVPADQAREDSAGPWYIFNDFTVQNITEEDALSFPGVWKVPAILWFQRVDSRSLLNLEALPMKLDPKILTQDICFSWHRDPTRVMHDILGTNEIPTPGTLIAIDTEFVQMQKEEIEARSDQFRKVIRPNKFALARVSVVRGNGPKEGVPFIDDYVQILEPVYDYVTQFSGIEPGDLDPAVSKHTVVPLKTVYQKIRLLVDLGCIFVGHGLAQDFRIINIHVPLDQVIDTVALYHLKNKQRKISLRFLAWFILKGNIQSGNHDSIEDARTALMLYKAYGLLEDEGKFDELLDRLDKEGKQVNYKVPVEALPPPLPRPPPPMPPMHSPVPEIMPAMARHPALGRPTTPTSRVSGTRSPPAPHRHSVPTPPRFRSTAAYGTHKVLVGERDHTPPPKSPPPPPRFTSHPYGTRTVLTPSPRPRRVS